MRGGGRGISLRCLLQAPCAVSLHSLMRHVKHRMDGTRSSCRPDRSCPVIPQVQYSAAGAANGRADGETMIRELASTRHGIDEQLQGAEIQVCPCVQPRGVVVGMCEEAVKRMLCEILCPNL